MTACAPKQHPAAARPHTDSSTLQQHLQRPSFTLCQQHPQPPKRTLQSHKRAVGHAPTLQSSHCTLTPPPCSSTLQLHLPVAAASKLQTTQSSTLQRLQRTLQRHPAALQPRPNPHKGNSILFKLFQWGIGIWPNVRLACALEKPFEPHHGTQVQI